MLHVGPYGEVERWPSSGSTHSIAGAAPRGARPPPWTIRLSTRDERLRSGCVIDHPLQPIASVLTRRAGRQASIGPCRSRPCRPGRLNRALLARQLLLERVPAVASPRRCRGMARHPEPVRPERVHPAVVVPHRIPPRRPDACLRGRDGRPGHPDARHDPRGGARRLPALPRRHRGTQREWGARVTKAPPTLDRSPALARVRAALAEGPMKRPALLALAARRASGGAPVDRHRPRDPARPTVGHLGTAPGRPVRAGRRRHRPSRRGGRGGRAARGDRALPRRLRAGIGRATSRRSWA